MFGRFEKRVIKAVRIVPETRLRHGWPGLGQEHKRIACSRQAGTGKPAFTERDTRFSLIMIIYM